MVDAPTAYLAIAMMALVTLGTRLGGAFVMRFVTLSPRVTSFLEAMSASVLAAIVVTFIVNNGAREAIAVGVAILVMLATRSAVWAMFAAMAFAAGFTVFLA
ncbi:MAG: AzlD domain-containing protein [Rhizobiales bacterium]|nr:AzlD domain-containing protein [Hyphomicrobiales bacterium]MBO6699981.1 AzlD domain-containing protein [Hyphomicrobiales bacterium]MBO6737854.1 AzlD domain-containing protein [Hyphomicrobiales bacterium]MBO6913089.1 AzlD domain-containing protein [Hyphomicrobiales bacterium]MBO6957235.1 AzlD domain-containing protein [Hyphomicrobiales bacterium]